MAQYISRGINKKTAAAINAKNGILSSRTDKSSWEFLVRASTNPEVRQTPGQISRASIFGSRRYRFRRFRSVSSTRTSDWTAFCFKNTVRGNYMEWYAQFSNWSTYNSSSAATDGQFKLKFYKVESMPVDPEEPAVEGLEVEASPKSGASVEAGQTIVLTAADGAEIYYTMSTDGAEPRIRT